MQFQKKVVAITGAAGGIGQELCRHFGDQGAAIFALDALDFTMAQLGKDRKTGEERHVGGRELRRFKERDKTRYKQWKLTDEDWRNRAKWDDYEHAVNEMVERTSTRLAPWTLIEGNDKYFARLKVLKTACSSLRKAL